MTSDERSVHLSTVRMDGSTGGDIGEDEMVLHGGSYSIDSDCSMDMTKRQCPSLEVQESSIAMQKKSKRQKALDRLQSKNRALMSILLQTKADLAEERQKRTTMDGIYQSIRKDLSQRLEAEGTKILTLMADLDRLEAENKTLKNQVRNQAPALSSSSSVAYRISYDNSAFSLTSDVFSDFGGDMQYLPPSQDVIGRYTDSETFLHYHSYSSATVGVHPTFTPKGAVNRHSNLKTQRDAQVESTSAFQSRQSSVVLPSLTEEDETNDSDDSDGDTSIDREIDSEDEDEDEDDNDSCTDDDDCEEAPRTMMEIILQRQQPLSPEDEIHDLPADAEETFASMAGKALFLTTRSKVTAAQAHLQLEDLCLKFDAETQEAIQVIAKDVLRWWEAHRVTTGGHVTGGWATTDADQAHHAKAEAEKKMESFFGPLLLQYVSSLADQKLLLEALATFATENPKWLKNHSVILMALYKHDVLDADAVLDWWHGLKEPKDVFSHGEGSLRNLNSRFAAWLEDDDDSDDDDEDDQYDSDSDFDSCQSVANTGEDEELAKDESLPHNSILYTRVAEIAQHMPNRFCDGPGATPTLAPLFPATDHGTTPAAGKDLSASGRNVSFCSTTALEPGS
ncbi:hypothetical protein BGZ83_000054 [Gryganskiella cystojenkinii]|nr:hypothetical protein BGZ83_000054 [Gryganskiella cystojenkinii]